jgi:hypothetical protein
LLQIFVAIATIITCNESWSLTSNEIDRFLASFTAIAKIPGAEPSDKTDSGLPPLGTQLTPFSALLKAIANDRALKGKITEIIKFKSDLEWAKVGDRIAQVFIAMQLDDEVMQLETRIGREGVEKSMTTAEKKDLNERLSVVRALSTKIGTDCDGAML